MIQLISVPFNYQHYRAGELAQSLPPDAWASFSCGNGTKGERLYDWARVEVNCLNEHGFKRWLLFRRNLEHPDEPRSFTYYQVYAHSDTSLEAMVYVAGKRWRIEECIKVAKGQCGLSDYEVRSWHGWHRHVTLVIAAQAFLNVLRHQVEPVVAQKNWLAAPVPSQMTAFKATRGLLSH